ASRLDPCEVLGGLGGRVGLGRERLIDLELGGSGLGGVVGRRLLDRFLRRLLGLRTATEEAHQPATANASDAPRCRAASACASSSRRLMTRLTESSPTVTPYSASAASIVPRLWVMTMNWVWWARLRSASANRPMF